MKRGDDSAAATTLERRKDPRGCFMKFSVQERVLSRTCDTTLKKLEERVRQYCDEALLPEDRERHIQINRCRIVDNVTLWADIVLRAEARVTSVNPPLSMKKRPHRKATAAHVSNGGKSDTEPETVEEFRSHRTSDSNSNSKTTINSRGMVQMRKERTRSREIVGDRIQTKAISKERAEARTRMASMRTSWDESWVEQEQTEPEQERSGLAFCSSSTTRGSGDRAVDNHLGQRSSAISFS